MSAPAMQVIVPVYRALPALQRLVEGLRRTLGAGERVLFCDDASPEPEVSAYLQGLPGTMHFEARVLRRERNLGFVGNVNAAFAETGADDVVLLNSDTLPGVGWLDRLRTCFAADARIATATPWSNNAEICSLPHLCRPGPLPDDPDRWARACLDACRDAYLDLPTGVGFCMAIRRACLDRIGVFDAETFGRGYGEENDFCLRAEGHGWRNVLCADAFVGHEGGASFSLEGLAPGGGNLTRLLNRYPDYNRRVAEFIMADPIKPLRLRVVERYAALAAGQPDATGLQGQLFQ
ncbi:glycosyltransferase family 2 protein [uncultured Aquimonas sp.]|uniref:glycosyltransferase family 2 protein n=1 Tax=uncultured Aquimonas sp. TaxID=385483 RepID=UPI00260B129D|nr:glycosyltransferase family 2 protein [uncultured Aquimonas sp.]